MLNKVLPPKPLKNIIVGCAYVDGAYTYNSHEHFMQWIAARPDKNQAFFLDKDYAKAIDLVVATLEDRYVSDHPALVYYNYARINVIGERLRLIGYYTAFLHTALDGVVELVYVVNTEHQQ